MSVYVQVMTIMPLTFFILLSFMLSTAWVSIDSTSHAILSQSNQQAEIAYTPSPDVPYEDNSNVPATLNPRAMPSVIIPLKTPLSGFVSAAGLSPQAQAVVNESMIAIAPIGVDATTGESQNSSVLIDSTASHNVTGESLF